MIDSDKAKEVVIGNWLNTNLEKNKVKISSLGKDLVAEYPNWQKARPNAKYHRYRTYSSSDSGPLEYRVVERIMITTGSLLSNITQITTPVQQSNAAVQNLVTLVLFIEMFHNIDTW